MHDVVPHALGMTQRVLDAALQGYLLQMLAMKLGVATSMHLAQHCRCAFLWPAA